jgi:hypothetical protein
MFGRINVETPHGLCEANFMGYCGVDTHKESRLGSHFIGVEWCELLIKKVG